MSLHRLPRNRQQGGILLWLLVLLMLGVLLLTLYLLRAPLLRGVAEWWIVDEPPEEAQAIVVLGGDTVMGDRVRHAVELYRAGWAPRLVLSGPSLRSYFSEAELMEQEATNLGVPAEHLIVVRHNSQSTQEEALALRRVIAEKKLRKIIVVTSNYHTRRVRTIFHAVYRRHGTQVRVSASADPNFDRVRWWQQREGRGVFLLEIVKSINTWWELRDAPPPSPTLFWLPGWN